MKKITIITASLLFSGCTTYSISNPALLEPIKDSTVNNTEELVTLPIKVDASTSALECYSSRSGRVTRTSCSNKKRLERISDEFEKRGYRAVIGKESSNPSLIIKEENEGFLVRMGTDIGNFFSLGLIPSYRYDDITITYTDPEENKTVSKSFRVSTGKSWFHLFMSNPEHMEDSWFNRAETNLLQSVLDEAKVKSNSL